MFRLCSQVVAYNNSEMRRWTECTRLQGSSNKHAHCLTETFPSTCGFYSHCEVCIEKITHSPLKQRLFFPRGMCSEKGILPQPLKNRRWSLLSHDSTVFIMPLPSGRESEGVEVQWGEKEED